MMQVIINKSLMQRMYEGDEAKSGHMCTVIQATKKNANHSFP